MVPPEILSFVAMPADMIEAVKPQNLCDGYPDAVREQLDRIRLNEEGYFANEFLVSLQRDGRLLTWKRSPFIQGGAPRPNPLIVQKYYKTGKVFPVFKGLHEAPFILGQCMGAGQTLSVDDQVEALKSGQFLNENWVPSEWKRAVVVAVNYDGTYDLQFPQGFGAVHERIDEFINNKGGKDGNKHPTLRGDKNMRYMGFGADEEAARYRMWQEMNFAQAVHPSRVRLPNTRDSIADAVDGEFNQDWFLCTSRQFQLTGQEALVRTWDEQRLSEFSEKFIVGYEWVPTEDGLEFRPLPTQAQALAMRTSHAQLASTYPKALEANDKFLSELSELKDSQRKLEKLLARRTITAPDVPTSGAGPSAYGRHRMEVDRKKELAGVTLMDRIRAEAQEPNDPKDIRPNLRLPRGR